jgi:hypothetical protein
MKNDFDLNLIKKELLDEHHNKVIKKINEFHKIDRGFILRDLIEENQNDNYYIYMTKGILLSLLAFNQIKIISTYNGNKNYVYFAIKEIK